MKKLFARILTAAMVIGLLTVSALAYDVPDNAVLEASSPSTGSVTITDYEGTDRIVYQYPEGTSFSVRRSS